MPSEHSKSLQQDMLLAKISLRNMLHHKEFMNMIFRTFEDHYDAQSEAKQWSEYTITLPLQLEILLPSKENPVLSTMHVPGIT